MTNCECSKAAINKGYIVQDSKYDEEKLDFITLDSYYMPLVVNNGSLKNRALSLTIKYCPICGSKL